DAVKRALLDGDASRLTEEAHKLAGVLSPFSLRAEAGLSSSRRAGVDRRNAALERLRRDRADKPPFRVRERGFRRLRPFLPAAIVSLAGRGGSVLPRRAGRSSFIVAPGPSVMQFAEPLRWIERRFPKP